jgi:hypothetical protein
MLDVDLTGSETTAGQRAGSRVLGVRAGDGGWSQLAHERAFLTLLARHRAILSEYTPQSLERVDISDILKEAMS